MIQTLVMLLKNYKTDNQKVTMLVINEKRISKKQR